MYKEILRKIQTEDLSKYEKSFSEEEVVELMKTWFHQQMEKNIGKYDEEELKKGLGRAFRNGLTVVGMLHGANYIGDQLDKKPQNPAKQISRSISSEKQVQKPKSFKPELGSSYKDRKMGNFLKAISMNESSGGKNLNHKQMKSGIHSGDSAVGRYGLMPNTIKEMAVRMGKQNPLNRYSKMDNSKVSESIKNNPQHEHEIANFMANHLHDKFGGDESKMAYSWFQGHNLTNDHFKDKHKDYKDHNYVQKFNKHKSEISKNPVKPEEVASNQ